jgi:hypothetical protein
MKSFKTLICAILIACLPVYFTGCQSINSSDPLVRIEKSVPYLRASAMVVTGYVFNYAVSEDDRAEKAQVVYDIAYVIEQLTVNGDVDIETFAQVVSHYVPDKSHWAEFAASIILIYADFHAQAQSFEQPEKLRVLTKALNAIAGGCRAAAKPYVE